MAPSPRRFPGAPDPKATQCPLAFSLIKATSPSSENSEASSRATRTSNGSTPWWDTYRSRLLKSGTTNALCSGGSGIVVVLPALGTLFHAIKTMNSSAKRLAQGHGPAVGRPRSTRPPMIVAGTDIKPLASLLSLRAPHIRTSFEQMKGCGVRVRDDHSTLWFKSDVCAKCRPAASIKLASAGRAAKIRVS
jgi:hypothetical protein